jgi:hypothetical protein
MAEKLRDIKINKNNINMLPLHSYKFSQKIACTNTGSNVQPNCAKPSDYHPPLAHPIKGWIAIRVPSSLRGRGAEPAPYLIRG